MKYSGVEWIGEIPDNWALERLQWHLEEIKESNDPVKTKQVLSLTNKLGVIPYEEKGEQGNKAKENVTEYKIAYPNTIVANSMNILIGSVGKCEYFGCVSPVYYVFKPKKGENIDFLNYVFQVTQFQKELRRFANGILEIRLRVSSSDILKRYIAFPPKEEQQKIVNFLNQKTQEIDSLIKIENQQIEKLKEYKQVVITEVVTKGLDKNAIMKDSGVKWIGMIPKARNIKRAKYIAEEFKKGNGITKEDVFTDGEIPCVRYGEIYTKYDNYFSVCITRTNLSNVTSPTFFEKGNLLFACTGELVEEIGKNVLYAGEEKCLAGGDIIVMKHKQHPGFINYAMNCTRSQMQKSYGKAKLKVVHISLLGIGNIYVCLPSLDEQRKISEYLDDFTESIKKIILIKQEKIEKLGEYKKSLIYEYVTGKKEVY